MNKVERIAHLWKAGKNTFQIAMITGMPESEVYQKLPEARTYDTNLPARGPRPTGPRSSIKKPKNDRPTVKRRCLGDGCDQEIESQHAGHRLCDICRTRS